MKITFLIISLLFISHSFSQKNNSVRTHLKAGRDVNYAKGSQTINYYYYTINNNFDKGVTSKENAINATSGFFKKQKLIDPSSPYIVMGRNLYNNIGHHDIQYENNPVDPIRITREKGQLQVNAVLRDSKGDEYARISGNIWEISNIENIEYNNDATGFEIRTGKRVLFQINIVGDTVFCNGAFCSEQGICIYYDSQSQKIRSKPSASQQRFFLPSDFYIKPLFKYPRLENLGVREK